MKTKCLILASLLAAVATASLAQGAAPAPAATPGVDQRQVSQDRRIDQGTASGALTAREARRLERQQDAIDRAEARAKSDGTVTARERQRLHRKQDRASRHIDRHKHDRRHGVR
jgi:hypothetical protein